MSVFCGGGKSHDTLADVYMKRANLTKADLDPVKVTGRTALHDAVVHNDPRKVKALAKQGQGRMVNTQDVDQNTPLHLARSRDVALLLLLAGADTRLINKHKLTAFHLAAASGNIPVLEAMIDYGRISVNLRIRPTYNTPLHAAVINNQIPAIHFLLNNGSEVDLRNAYGLSALHLAVERGSRDVTMLLLDHGATLGLTVQDDVLQQPGHNQREMREVAWKYPPNCQAIHIASIRCSTSMLRLLLSRGADVDARGAWDMTPLHIALLRRNYETARCLITEGGDVNACTSVGDTALHLAVAGQNAAILKTLLEHGAKRKVFNKDGFTPLHAASLKGWARGVEILSAWGADTSTLSEGDGYTPLNLAASTGSLRAVEALLENHAMVNDTNSDGRTSLHIAVEKGNGRVAQVLLKNGASVNQPEPETQDTPLHIAARYCRVDIMHALLTRGAYVDAMTARDETALHVLAGSIAHVRKAEAADLLLRRGVYLEARDKSKRTALYVAMKQRDQQLCLMLLAHGADTCSVPRKKSPSIAALFFRGDEAWGDNFAYALISAGCDLTQLSTEMHSFTRSTENSRGLTMAFDLVMYVYERLVTPLPLKQLCRRTVRRLLKDNAEGLSLVHDVVRLPCSTELKQYLMLGDCGVNVTLEDDSSQRRHSSTSSLMSSQYDDSSIATGARSHSNTMERRYGGNAWGRHGNSLGRTKRRSLLVFEPVKSPN